MTGQDGRVVAVVDVALAELAQIRAHVDGARITLAAADDVIDGAVTGLVALRDSLTPEDGPR